jgi:hypothetical protein
MCGLVYVLLSEGQPVVFLHMWLAEKRDIEYNSCADTESQTFLYSISSAPVGSRIAVSINIYLLSVGRDKGLDVD